MARERTLSDQAFEQFPQALIVVDREATVLSMNAVAERLTGWQRSDAVGRPAADLIVQDEALIRQVNATLGARIAILCVPAIAAQNVAEEAIAAGVRVILNFAPIILRVPERIVVRNVSFLQELAVLSYHLSSETQK